MPPIINQLQFPGRSHLARVMDALGGAGWTVTYVPPGAVASNGQEIILRAGRNTRAIRLFVYKVTGSGRSKQYERRIEITTTYPKGLARSEGFPDVVLGVDTERDIFVGVDPRRMEYGGPTGNASSFFDIAGLNWDKQDEILILPRSAKLFPGGVEFHAFMFSRCLSEYLFHYETIHAGIYRGSGLFSGVPQSVPINAPIAFSPGRAIILEKAEPSHAKAASPVEVAALESGNMKYFRKRQISPDRFSLVQRTAEQNGLLGEEFVLDHERKSLRRAGRADLADVVKWVSRISVCEGFDILSYSANGEEKWIEVKSTAGKSRVFEMSDNEWQTCSQAGTKYFIYRVTSVTSGKPSLEIVQNPAALEAGGQISKTPTGWRVTLR